MMEPTGETQRLPSWVLDCLQCPQTGEALEMASAEQLDRLKARQTQSKLINAVGMRESVEFEQALINASQTWCYLIRCGIPNLVPGDAIPLAAADEPPSPTTR